MAKIEFENKQALNENANIPDINKVKDSDLNEIKNVVNQTILNSLFGVYYDTWTSSGTFNIGDIVIYDAILYENLTGNNTATTPDQDSTNWQVVNILLNTKLNPKLIDKTDFIKNSNNNSQINTYSCNYANNHFQLQPTTLYNNASGTASTISNLSDNVENYDYIEIYFKTNDTGSAGSTKIISSPSGTKVATLFYIWFVGNTDYVKSATINISQKTISFKSNIQYQNFGQRESGNFVYITKVVGYK